MSISKDSQWRLRDASARAIIRNALLRYFRSDRDVFEEESPYGGTRIGWRESSYGFHRHEIYFDIDQYRITSHHCGHYGVLRDTVIEELEIKGRT